jgi:hypothetical protein
MNEQNEDQHTTELLAYEVINHSRNNEMAVENAVKRHQRKSGLVLFNREENKRVRQHIMAELEKGFEFRQKALAITLETKLQTLEEACNHILITGKTCLRKQRTEFFAKELMGLKQNMDAMVDTFATRIDERLMQVEKYQSELIQQREKARLEKSIGDFLDTLDQLVGDFINIINESVHR